MKKVLKNTSLVIVIAIWFCANNVPATAQESKKVYEAAGEIKLSGDGGHDYVHFDEKSNKLFVTHGITVDVIDLKSGKYIGSVTGLGGDHGVVIDNQLGRGYVSDSKLRALVAFDTKTLKTIKSIPLKGEDEDALVLDPITNKVFVFEGDSHQAEVVDAGKLVETNVIDLGAKPEFAVSNGKGLIYVNLQSANKVAVIDVRTMKVTKEFNVDPGEAPTGLAFDTKNQRLFVGCRGNKGLSVVNAQSGKVLQTLPIGNGVDAVCYDPETHLIFASCVDGTTTIIKQETPDKYQVLQILKTAPGARTMALDTKTHKIYLSVSDFVNNDRHKPAPGTFRVLVYKMI